MIKKNDCLFCFLLKGNSQNDICIGVPCIIGKNGVEEIVDIKLDDNESTICKSADAVRLMNDALKSILE
jgi:malate dehydrogenase